MEKCSENMNVNISSFRINYVSCIKIDGIPILPPLLSEADRAEMRRYRALAIKIQDKINRLKSSCFSDSSFVTDSDTIDDYSSSSVISFTDGSVEDSTTKFSEGCTDVLNMLEDIEQPSKDLPSESVPLRNDCDDSNNYRVSSDIIETDSGFKNNEIKRIEGGAQWDLSRVEKKRTGGEAESEENGSVKGIENSGDGKQMERSGGGIQINEGQIKGKKETTEELSINRDINQCGIVGNITRDVKERIFDNLVQTEVNIDNLHQTEENIDNQRQTEENIDLKNITSAQIESLIIKQTEKNVDIIKTQRQLSHTIDKNKKVFPDDVIKLADNTENSCDKNVSKIETDKRNSNSESNDGYSTANENLDDLKSPTKLIRSRSFILENPSPFLLAQIEQQKNLAKRKTWVPKPISFTETKNVKRCSSIDVTKKNPIDKKFITKRRFSADETKRQRGSASNVSIIPSRRKGWDLKNARAKWSSIENDLSTILDHNKTKNKFNSLPSSITPSPTNKMFGSKKKDEKPTSCITPQNSNFYKIQPKTDTNSNLSSKSELKIGESPKIKETIVKTPKSMQTKPERVLKGFVTPQNKSARVNLFNSPKESVPRHFSRKVYMPRSTKESPPKRAKETFPQPSGEIYRLPAGGPDPPAPSRESYQAPSGESYRAPSGESYLHPIGGSYPTTSGDSYPTSGESDPSSGESYQLPTGESYRFPIKEPYPLNERCMPSSNESQLIIPKESSYISSPKITQQSVLKEPYQSPPKGAYYSPPKEVYRSKEVYQSPPKQTCQFSQPYPLPPNESYIGQTESYQSNDVITSPPQELYVPPPYKSPRPVLQRKINYINKPPLFKPLSPCYFVSEKDKSQNDFPDPSNEIKTDIILPEKESPSKPVQILFQIDNYKEPDSTYTLTTEFHSENPDEQSLSIKSNTKSDLKDLFSKMQHLQKIQLLELMRKQKEEQEMFLRAFSEQQTFLLSKLSEACQPGDSKNNNTYTDLMNTSEKLLTECKQILDDNNKKTELLNGNCDSIYISDSSQTMFTSTFGSNDTLNDSEFTLQNEVVSEHPSEVVQYLDNNNDIHVVTSRQFNRSISNDSLELAEHSKRSYYNGDKIVAKIEKNITVSIDSNMKEEPKRRWKQYSPEEVQAVTVINAAVRGYLVRRLFKSERVQNLIQTIKDTLLCAMELHHENVEKIQPADIELHRRLIQQVTAACTSFHDVFFKLSLKEQMAVIALDRQRKKEKLLKPTLSKSPSLSSTTQRRIEKKLKRDNSADYSSSSNRSSFSRTCHSADSRRVKSLENSDSAQVKKSNITQESLRRSTGSAGSANKKPWR